MHSRMTIKFSLQMLMLFSVLRASTWDSIPIMETTGKEHGHDVEIGVL